MFAVNNRYDYNNVIKITIAIIYVSKYMNNS